MGSQDDKQRPILVLEEVGFSYPGRSQQVLCGVSLSLHPGEAVLLTGPTGCGKSTLLKTLNGIIPLESSGRMTGRVLVGGRDTRNGSVTELARGVGLVFQSPDDQFFGGSVGQEVAFGPQNLGLDPGEIKQRVERALGQVGLEGFKKRSVAHLSGGQKQRVAIASQLAMHPLILALDEPISQLDPMGASEVLAVLRSLVKKGMAILLVEHRIGEVIKLATRVLVMDQGKTVLDVERGSLPDHIDVLDTLGLQVPDEDLLAKRLGLDLSDDWQERVVYKPDAVAGDTHTQPTPNAKKAPGPLMEMEEVGFTYTSSAAPALEQVSMSVAEGEVVGVLGPNGSGKSTLLGILAGLQQPEHGTVRLEGIALGKRARRALRGKVALLMQNPDLLLIEPSVKEELLAGPRYLKRRFDDHQTRRLAKSLDIAEHLDMPPWALSKGQRLRVALAALMAMRPSVLLLDEPTTGQNRLNVQRLLAVVENLPGLKATVICSHDLETVCRFAHRLVVLDRGRVVAQGPTREIVSQPDVLQAAGLKPTLPLRLSYRLGRTPPWITANEMIDSLQAMNPPEAATK